MEVEPNRISRMAWGRWGLRGAAVGYIALIVMLPLSVLIKETITAGPAVCWASLVNPVAIAALKLTLTGALLTALINGVLGTLTAYVLVNYRFPGRDLFNSIIDLPFAIPTLVTGLMLVALYGPQRMLGGWLAGHGIKVIFATPGILLALLLVTYPFVIRSVQAVLLELDERQTEAAATMGASQLVIFLRIILPAITPAILIGALLSFARALGEFGSIVAVAGNIPGRTLTAPVYIYGQIESDNQAGASVLSLLLLIISYALVQSVAWLQQRREQKDVG
jgi:sulfate/thiosulfate transport system permease protein